MMSPSVVFGEDGVRLVVGSAGSLACGAPSCR